MRLRTLSPAIVIALFAASAVGQSAFDYKESKAMDLTLTAGTFLPYGIVGVRDTYPMWNLGFSHPTPVARFEWAFYNIHAKGVKYYNGSVGPRIDFHLDDFLSGFFSIGANLHYYQRKRTQTREFPYYTAGGIHFGFGAVLEITKSLDLRADFKLNYGPGRSLYTGIGFIYRFGGEGESGVQP